MNWSSVWYWSTALYEGVYDFFQYAPIDIKRWWWELMMLHGGS